MIDNLSTAPIVLPQVQTGTVATGFNTSLSAFSSEFTQGAIAGTLNYPLDVGKYIITFSILNYSRQTLNTIGTLTPAAGYPSIVMPLPAQLVDSNHVNWQELPIVTLGSEAGAIAGGALGGFLGGLGNLVEGGILGTLGATAGAMIQPGLEAEFGVSPNQFVTMLFRGPTYKRHRFTWNVSPTNFQEADNLRQIVNTFKNAMAPSFGLSGFVWQFPKIFHIRLYPNSGQLYKFKPAICDYFTVNYTPSGRGAFYYNPTGVDGANPPEGMQIEAHFCELEFWVEGNYGTNQLDNDPDHVNHTGSPGGVAATPANIPQNVELQQLQGPF